MLKTYTLGAFQTNTYLLVKEDKCIIIDPTLSFAQAACEIKQQYKVEKILLTHGHLDHIDGAKYFDCPIYINKAEKAFLFDSSLSMYNMIREKSPFTNKQSIVCFEDEDEIEFACEAIKVIHTPGHTTGSSCFLYKNKLFSGDTLFKLGIGRTDFPTGDMAMMDKSILKLINQIDDNVIVYPGHGEKTSIKEERKHNPYYLQAKKRLK